MDELQNENKETIEGVGGAENTDVKTEAQGAESIDTEKIATIQSREISTSIILQSSTQLKNAYKEIDFLEKIARKRTVDYSKKEVENLFAHLEKKLADCKETFMKHFEE